MMTRRFSSVLLLAGIALTGCQREHTTGTPVVDTSVPPGTTDTTPPSATSGTTTSITGGTVAALTNADKVFIVSAGQSGIAEVALGQLASRSATHAEVKAFATRMVAEHGRANDELKKLAVVKGLALPTDLTDDQKETRDDLEKRSGAAFDRAYMDVMVRDHETTLADFRNAANDSTDSEIKSWASSQLPLLEEHLRMAKAIRGKLR